MRKYLKQTRQNLKDLFEQEKDIYSIASILKNSNHIFICGNGGSSATASHFANDLQKMCGLRAYSLTNNVSMITALANDLNYTKIFSEQLDVLADYGDTLILISGSGCSVNLLEALKWGLKHDMEIIAFLGQDGGTINCYDINKIHIKSDMQHAEDWHLIICHIITNMLKK